MDTLNPGHILVLILVAIITLATRHRLFGVKRPSSIDKTYRIRGVPIDWDTKQLESFLAANYGPSAPAVGSLAREIHGRYSSATVRFRGGTPNLDISLRNSPAQLAAGAGSLTLDTDFLGVTTLFAPPEDDHNIDIIAVPGLGGHAFGSFKERGGDHVWLRDALPGHIVDEDTKRPMARVMTYGYESTVATSNNFQNLSDLATSLHNALLEITRSSGFKHVVFIAHSLGGLIVKQANAHIVGTVRRRDFQEDCAGCIRHRLFWCSHGGMDIKSIILMAGDGPNRPLVDSISRINSDMLTTLQREFRLAMQTRIGIKIACFYETRESPTAQQVCSYLGLWNHLLTIQPTQDKNGRWGMTGPPAVLVTKASATGCTNEGSEGQWPIGRTHTDIVKFGPHDHGYDATLRIIRRIAAGAAASGSREYKPQTEQERMRQWLFNRTNPSAGPQSTHHISVDQFFCVHENDLDQEYPGQRFWYRERIGQNGYPPNVTVEPQFLGKDTKPIGPCILACRRIANLQIRGHVKWIDPGHYRLVWIFWFFAGRQCPPSSQRVPECWIPQPPQANSVYERYFPSNPSDNTTLTPDSPWFYPWNIRCSAGQARQGLDFLNHVVDVDRHPSVPQQLLVDGYEEQVISPGLWNTLRNTGWCEVKGPQVRVGNQGELFIVISKDFIPRWIGGISFGGMRLELID